MDRIVIDLTGDEEHITNFNFPVQQSEMLQTNGVAAPPPLVSIDLVEPATKRARRSEAEVSPPPVPTNYATGNTDAYYANVAKRFQTELCTPKHKLCMKKKLSAEVAACILECMNA